MKKIAIFLFILIILSTSLIYGVLFTKTGNEYVASYIKEKIDNKEKNILLTINKFELTTQDLIFNALINDNSLINIAGKFSLFGGEIDLKYDLKIKELSNLQNLLGLSLNGEFNTNGTLKGTKESSTIQGNSNVAKSDTFYNFTLEDFDLKNGLFFIKNAKAEDLLNLVNMPKYVSGIVDIKGDIKNLDMSNLDGKIDISYDKGFLQTKIINKEFNQNINSLIPLKSDINIVLNGDKIDIKSNLISSVVEVFINKTVYDMDKKEGKSDYKIEVKNLNVLEQIINKKLNGNFMTKGVVDYKENTLFVDGDSNIAEGYTKYNFKVENAILKDLIFSVENVKIDKLLAMLNEPVYALGKLSINGKISSTQKENLDGEIVSKIQEGKTINEVLNTVYNQKLTQNIDFDFNVKTKLIPNQIISKVVINSSVANLNMSELIYDLKENLTKGDYLLKIADLSKLNDISFSKMRGSLDVGGKIKTKEDSLTLEGISKIAGGVLEFTLKNDKLKANIKDINSKDFAYMFTYPQFFESKVDGDIDYNLLLKKGKMGLVFDNGHFVENQFTNLIKEFGKYDISKDIYKTFNVQGEIDQKVLKSTFSLKNENTQIDMVKSTIDFENNTIDSNIKIKIKDKEFGIGVLDSLENPTVILDSKDFLKSKLDRTQQKIEDKLNKLLDKL